MGLLIISLFSLKYSSNTNSISSWTISGIWGLETIITSSIFGSSRVINSTGIFILSNFRASEIVLLYLRIGEKKVLDFSISFTVDKCEFKGYSFILFIAKLSESLKPCCFFRFSNNEKELDFWISLTVDKCEFKGYSFIAKLSESLKLCCFFRFSDNEKELDFWISFTADKREFKRFLFILFIVKLSESLKPCCFFKFSDNVLNRFSLYLYRLLNSSIINLAELSEEEFIF